MKKLKESIPHVDYSYMAVGGINKIRDPPQETDRNNS